MSRRVYHKAAAAAGRRLMSGKIELTMGTSSGDDFGDGCVRLPLEDIPRGVVDLRPPVAM